MVRSRAFLFVLGTAMLVVGCGGDGSAINNGLGGNQVGMNANAVSKAPSSGSLGVFLTDNSGSHNDHVWISVKKVELKLAAGGMRTVFEDAQGVGVDLAVLRDESGPKYRFLNALELPAGTYLGATLTLGKNALVFPKNSTTGKAVPFEKLKEGSSESVIHVQFDPPKMLGAGINDLVLELKLNESTEDKGALAASVGSSLGAGLEDADRNASYVATGKVENLKGDSPAQTFLLKKGDVAEISVITSPLTALALNASDDKFKLSKGQTVEVSGKFDTNTRRFEAQSIRLKDPKAPGAAQVAGVVSSIDAKTESWSITPNLTRGFLPDALAVSVSLAADAKLFGPNGLAVSKDEFLKSLSSDEEVNILVEGSYDAEKGKFLCAEARHLDVVPQPPPAPATAVKP